VAGDGFSGVEIRAGVGVDRERNDRRGMNVCVCVWRIRPRSAHQGELDDL
jgi:hypothetical protein